MEIISLLLGINKIDLITDLGKLGIPCSDFRYEEIEEDIDALDKAYEDILKRAGEEEDKFPFQPLLFKNIYTIFTGVSTFTKLNNSITLALCSLIHPLDIAFPIDEGLLVP